MLLKTRDPNDNMKWKEYSFNSFEVFYIFMQKLVSSIDRLKSFRTFNWESDVVRKRFLDFYNSHKIASLTSIRNELHCKTDKCFQKKFWIERGWDNPEEKIKEVQKKNAKKFCEAFKENPDMRTTSTQLKWWTKKGYTEDEAKELLSERQKTFSKEKCIEKYGKEKGEIIFRNRQRKWRKTLDERYSKETQYEWQRSAVLYSRQSSELFTPFYDLYKNTYTCFLEPFTKEFLIKSKEKKKFYLYDFTIKELGLIFEFNGSHVHANPSWPKEKLDNWRQCFNHETAYENIKHYKQKILAAEQQGFKVVVLWNTDKNSPEIISREIEAKLHTLQQQHHPFLQGSFHHKKHIFPLQDLHR